MSFITSHQQQYSNYSYGQLIALLDVNENGRLVFPFSRRLILIDGPFENKNENEKDKRTGTNDANMASEVSSEFSENSSMADDENYTESGSFGSLSSPPTPFDYDPYDSYDWES